MAHLSQLALAANSIQLTDMMALLFENDNERDFKLLRELRDDELEKARGMMKLISETQLKLLGFACLLFCFFCLGNHPLYVKFRSCYVFLSLKVELPVVLHRANVFETNGIDLSDYTITLAHGVSLDVDDPVDVALAYREKMVLFLNTKLVLCPHLYLVDLDHKVPLKRQLPVLKLSKERNSFHNLNILFLLCFLYNVLHPIQAWF
ncbi:hypothetical protein Tco_0324787 [Tanacetum coccineum]